MIFNRIFVLGSGAVGSTYGALLSKKEDVTLIGRKAHVDAINSNGLFLHGEFEGKYDVKADTEIREIPSKSLVILSTKVTGSKKAIRGIRHLVKKDTIVLLVQNGVGIQEIVKKILPDHEVIRAVVTLGAEFLEPGKISNVVLIRIDLEKSKNSEKIARLLKDCGLVAEISNNINMQVWTKLTINSVLNPLTAIFQVRGNEIITDSLKPVRYGIVDECLEVAEAEEIEIHPAIKEMIDAGVSNFFNYSSMCQDMIKRKKTEIDFLNGKVVELGKKHDIPTPFNELIVAFIKFLEEKSENRS
ncbi:ketopantoate reductase family protein [Candidatus Bathyarchaeota archaeon]|nr:ketopantoate reductase family protein [Candidatus Bathyarchaeota archaeon]